MQILKKLLVLFRRSPTPVGDPMAGWREARQREMERKDIRRRKLDRWAAGIERDAVDRGELKL